MLHLETLPGRSPNRFYAAAKARVASSTAESYMFTVRSFFNWCVLAVYAPYTQIQQYAAEPRLISECT